MVSQSKIHPIVYIRGYAGTQGEVEDTVADPYMGFNIGSTKLRQNWDGSIAKHIFESPLVRLMKDYGYRDAYLEGSEFGIQSKVGHNSVWIYRYYESVSKDLGDGERPEMEVYAKGLGEYLQNIRTIICGKNKKKRTDFKVYLVAHSMGGLVVRCWLQNIRLSENDPVTVKKVFTYATPHNGIELKGVGNIPKLFKINNTENFNHDRMRDYLNLPDDMAINSLNGKFPEQNFFSLIGTNSKDYTAAVGLAKKAVGSFSDGLVKIKNAYVAGSPRAFVHRAHSGHYGVVNSEEGYQNLKRFFFGNVRVDGSLRINSLNLPKKIAQAQAKGKEVRAAYHIEVITKVRDARWDLYRRTVHDESAIYLAHDDVAKGDKQIRLFSSYLATDSITPVRKNRRNNSEMGFAVSLGLLSPEYVVDNKFFFDDYYKGDYLFNDQLKFKVKIESDRSVIKYQWSSDNDDKWTTEVLAGPIASPWLLKIPYLKDASPGIDAVLELLISPNI